MLARRKRRSNDRSERTVAVAGSAHAARTARAPLRDLRGARADNENKRIESGPGERDKTGPGEHTPYPPATNLPWRVRTQRDPCTRGGQQTLVTTQRSPYRRSTHTGSESAAARIEEPRDATYTFEAVEAPRYRLGMSLCMCIVTCARFHLSLSVSHPPSSCRGAADRLPVPRIFIWYLAYWSRASSSVWYLYCTPSAPRAAPLLSRRPPRDARASHCARARTCVPCACRGTLGMPWPRHRGLGRAQHPAAVVWAAR